MKTCYKCKTEKEYSEFYRNSSRGDGHNSACKLCDNARTRKPRKRVYVYDADKDRNQDLKYKYGITLVEYNAMLEAQEFKCLGCGRHRDEFKIGFAVDHDHACCPGQRACGKCLRGLLCTSCNNALGLVRDNAETLRALANYLELSKILKTSC